MARSGVLAKIRSVWKTLTNKDTVRDVQERSDLYKIALASAYRQQRIDAASSKNTQRIQELNDRKVLGELYDKASEYLEVKKEAHDLPIRSLRLLVQKMIGPQVEDILEACKAVDDKDMRSRDSMTNINFDLQEQTEIEKDEIIDFCKDFLVQERRDIECKVEDFKMNDQGSSESCQKRKGYEYLEQKLSALRTISTHYNWETHDTFETPSNGDAFGYFMSPDQEINDSIRYYQMINLTRALMIRQHIGYAPLALQSTIPGAGRGVFVDGFAPAGTLLTFFPGDVWPKEHLININTVSKTFKDDPKQQLSVRYDDILIDSRKSPYTVLDNDRSNLFALGHIVNHPPTPDDDSRSNSEGDVDDGDAVINDGTNCSTVMVDFLEKMQLEKRKLLTYVPNTYKKPPMVFGTKAMDLEPVVMQGFGLIAHRDLENEEMFFDYRLSPGSDKNGSYPEWYHVCDSYGLQKRWSLSE